MSSIITYPSDPGIGIASGSIFTLTRKSTALRSPYTGKRQALAMPYALWTLKGSYTTIAGVGAAKLRSFLVQLEGQANKFRLPVPGVNAPLSGYAGATGLVNGAGQTGQSLITDGWSISTKILVDGDYFTVNDELKLVVGDVTTNGSGQATIVFKPSLRASPADNAALNVNSPTVMMSSNIDDAAGFTLSAPVLHDIPIDYIEAVE